MGARRSVTIAMLITATILTVSQGWISQARERVNSLVQGTAPPTPGASGESGFDHGSAGGGASGGGGGSW